MSEFKGLEQMLLPFEGPPDWLKEWGREAVGSNSRILDQTFGYSRKKPLEHRNNLLRVMKEELCPLYNRWRDAVATEHRQIVDICEFYNKEETGVFNVILSDYDKFIETLPARYPDLYRDLMTVIEESDDYFPVMSYGPGRIIGSVDPAKPTITLQYGNPILGDVLMIKSYRIMCGRLFKKAALQKQQTQILARTLEENGLQLPPEFADIERQLDDLQQPGPEWHTQQPGPEWPTQQPAPEWPTQQPDSEGPLRGPLRNLQELMKRQDPSPRARPFAVIQQDPDRPEFTGMFVNQAPPFVMPKRQMLSDHCKHLLDSLKTFKFSRSFWGPPTEEEAPGYFDVVRQHRDFSTIQHNIEETVGYCPREFFQDLRLMIDNNCYFFGEGSIQHRRALLFEKKLLENLPRWGEAGLAGKKQFKDALRAEFNDAYGMPDDDDSKSIPEDDGPFQQSDANNENDHTFGSDVETSFAQNLNDQWASDYGDENDRNFDGRNEVFDNQDGGSYEGSPTNESTILRGPSSPSTGEDNTIERAFNAAETAKQYDRDVGNATRAPIRHDTQQPGGSFSARSPSPRLDDNEPGEQPVEDFSFYDEHNYPNPDSTVFAPASEGTAGEAGEVGTHANAQASHQLAPIASMEAEQPIIDLTSSPQGQSSHTGPDSTKRARDSDDQESLDDDAPLVKRCKSAGKRPAAAVATSSRKRSRSDGDSDGDYVDDDDDDQESSDDDAPLIKRHKSAGKRPAAAVATSSRKRSRNDGDGDGDDEREQPSKRQRGSSLPAPAPLPQQLLQNEAWAELPPSPVPEPLTPVAAPNDGHRSVSPQAPEPAHAGSSRDVAAGMPQPEPATRALGHTDQGTITATQLHKLPKWKKNARTRGRSIANRPWVFGFGFGEDYGLYVMSCPTKGCPKEGVDTLPDVFRFHPLKCNDSDCHLLDCHGDFGDGSNEDKVRKFCKQVVSDEKKAVSIEWARKWNEDLIEEYGMPDDWDLRSHNF